MVEISTKKVLKYTPKIEAYKKVNSYTSSPSKQQIITIIFFIVLISIHETCITPSVHQVQQPILWTMFGFRYALLIMIIYDYVKLTIKDPVDRMVIDPSRRQNFAPYELRKCSICVSTVQYSSHHCMTCNRCTEDFDHHCKYLNNCIGVRNYEYFIRILFTFTFFLLLGIFMAAWILIQNDIDIFISESKKWVIVVYIILSGLITIVVAALLVFHLYISCCANITTLKFVMSPKQQKKPKLKFIQPSPLSAEYFKRNVEQKEHQFTTNQYGKSQLQQDKLEVMEYYRK